MDQFMASTSRFLMSFYNFPINSLDFFQFFAILENTSNPKAMKSHPNELFFYYNPVQSGEKQARAYARSVSKNINEINLQKQRLTTTTWRSILDKLNLRAKDLLNRSHPDYQSRIAGKSWDDESWLYILANSPHLIKAPIAIKRGKAVLCTTPLEVLKLR